MTRLRGALIAAAALAMAGCDGESGSGNTTDNATDSVAAIKTQPKNDRRADVVTVDPNQGLTLPTGGTPMAQRVAVLGVLNKRNGETREVRLKPGEAVRVGDAIVRLRACEKTASWEPQQLTGAFVQLDVRQPDNKWRRVFSGWLYKEQPALNVIQHGIYDVWPKSCEMSWPDGGTAVAGDAAEKSARRRSNTEKSAPAPSTGSGDAGSPAPSAAPSNAT